jgi:hypothetical protein
MKKELNLNKNIQDLELKSSNLTNEKTALTVWC